MQGQPSAKQSTPPKIPDRYILFQFLSRTFFGILLTAALLFIPAGRFDWLMGWVYIAGFALISLITVVAIDPDLIAERELRRQRSPERWDRVVFGLYGLITGIAIPVVAGLDVRYGWLPEIQLAIQVASIAFYTLGWALNIWAMRVNPFFSKVVRIQRDRTQTVSTAGPYRYIRHPGYAGGMAFNLASPLILGSLWALLAGVIAALLLILRTALEDRMLKNQLDGYQEYAAQVRYRLVPGLW